MNSIRRWKRLAGNIGLMVMVAIGLCACGDHWKEEVLLHDGSKIVVDRSQSCGGRHEIGQSAPIREQELSFNMPGSGKRLSFKSEYGEDIGRANFKLLALHILNGTPYVVAEPNLCLSYNKWGRPNPPYVIFKHDGKDWQRISLKDLPTEFRDVNLVVETKADAKRFSWFFPLSAEFIKQLNSSLTQPEFKTILREPLANGNGCAVPTTASRSPVAPVVNGEIIYFNWWPLATDWLNKTYGKSK